MATQTSFGAIGGQNIFAGNQFHGANISISPSNDAPRQPQTYRAIRFLRNKNFVQRSALSSQLARLLPATTTEFQSAALWGLGGSGKTQLALQYVYDRCTDPKCSVFWVHADTETSFAQDYRWIATKLGIGVDLDGEDLLKAVRLHIESLLQWVLIIDNADNLSLFGIGPQHGSVQNRSSNLYDYVPHSTSGTVLWTSRNRRILGSLVNRGDGVNVVQMSDAESRQLFQAVSELETGRSGKQDDLAQLLAEVEWLPLAITQAAAYIFRTEMSISDYLKRIRQRKKRWEVFKQSEDDPHRRPEVSNSVLETWIISMEHIEKHNELAYKILKTLAYVGNQNIPFEMIREISRLSTIKSNDYSIFQERGRSDHSSDSGEDYSSEDDVDSKDSSGDDDDEEAVIQAISQLQEFSFLTSRATSNGETEHHDRSYNVHKLVHEAISYNLSLQKATHPAEIVPAEAVAAKLAFEAVNELFPTGWSRETWDQCDKYLAHIQSASEWAQLHGGEKNVARLLSRVSSYLYDRGRWNEKQIGDTTALKLRKKVLGRKHPDTIKSMASLATTYFQQGRYKEDETLSLQVLALRQEVLGEKHPDTIESMASLASTYFKQGRSKEDETLSVQVLALRREVLGEKHPDTIESTASLATTYHQQGKYDVAEKMYVQVLALRREVLGEKHPDTIESTASLAKTYHRQGKYGEAEKMKVEVLALHREVLGEKHPDTIESMASLASTYHQQGKYDEADKIDVEVLALRGEVLGEKHPDTIESMASLATTYHRQGKYDVAEKMYVQVRALRRELLGEKHPDTIKSMASLTVTYFKQGRYKEDETLSLQVLALRREVLGEKHPDTIESMASLATTYHQQGKYGEAEKIKVKVLALCREVLGEKHPDTIESMESLAATYYTQGRYMEAEKIDVQIPDLWRCILGPRHPDTITSMTNLGSTYEALERYKEAEDIYVEVIQLRRDILGEAHRDTIESVSQLERTRDALMKISGEDSSSLSVADLSLK